MKIAIIVEGRTEKAFIPHLRNYLSIKLATNMPRLSPNLYYGRIPTKEKLRRRVETLLSGRDAVDHVIALTDVYTGTRPYDFENADNAKRKMREWVGSDIRFHPHAAQYDFEAWLLPYWNTIQRHAGSNRRLPGNPELINHNNPPAHLLGEIYRIGTKGIRYSKPVIANKILEGNDLSVAIAACTELKAFVNTILKICGSPQIT
jgi:hypothetical protein